MTIPGNNEKYIHGYDYLGNFDSVPARNGRLVVTTQAKGGSLTYREYKYIADTDAAFGPESLEPLVRSKLPYSSPSLLINAYDGKTENLIV